MTTEQDHGPGCDGPLNCVCWPPEGYEPTTPCPTHGEQPAQPELGYATAGSDPYAVEVLVCGCHVACFGPGEPYVVLRTGRPSRYYQEGLPTTQPTGGGL